MTIEPKIIVDIHAPIPPLSDTIKFPVNFYSLTKKRKKAERKTKIAARARKKGLKEARRRKLLARPQANVIGRQWGLTHTKGWKSYRMQGYWGLPHNTSYRHKKSYKFRLGAPSGLDISFPGIFKGSERDFPG